MALLLRETGRAMGKGGILFGDAVKECIGEDGKGTGESEL